MLLLLVSLTGCTDTPIPKEAFDKGTLMCAQNTGLYSISRYSNITQYVIMCNNRAEFRNVEVK